jgi:murein DD-endopeptidase MepM/ murein hydrolase activator NlpD
MLEFADRHGIHLWRPAAVTTGAIFLSISLGFAPFEAEARREALSSLGPMQLIPLALPPDPAPAAPAPEEEHPAWQEVRIRSGDTLGRLFQTHGLRAGDLREVMRAGAACDGLKRLKVGQPLRFQRGDDGALLALNYQDAPDRQITVRRTPSGFSADIERGDVEVRRIHTYGEIHDSLFSDGQRAGLSDAKILKLADIFAYDIDFALDLQDGDRFSLIHEEYWLHGEKIGDGPILAAEFVNEGKAYSAARFTAADGSQDFYGFDGRGLKKAFIRTPVEFARISSLFNLQRRHPILNTIRAHKGVDYAAPTGTPVRATGNGKVITLGSKNGYGKTVEIAHSNGVTTLYGHLNGYRTGLRSGARVRQGEVIGYVGMTGLATGPHLHYEFRVNGAHKNPLTVPLPKSEPIPAAQLARFKAETTPLAAQLALIARRHLAAR